MKFVRSRLAMLLILSGCLVPQVVQADTWTFASARFTTLFESATDGTSSIYGEVVSIDLSVDSYIFPHSVDTGLYVHTRLVIPRNGTLITNGQTSHSAFENYDTFFGLATVVGLGFRVNIASGSHLLFGIGPSFTFLNGYYTGYVEQLIGPPEVERFYFWTMIIGIGGDIAVKLDLMPSFFLKIGTGLAVNVANYSQAPFFDRILYGWSTNYLSLIVSPYLGIGVSL